MFLKISQDGQENTKKLQKYLAINSDFIFEPFTKFIIDAEAYWLPQFFSNVEIENLQNVFDRETPSVKHIMIFDLINKIVLHYAFYLALPYLNAQIGSAGVKKRTSKGTVIETTYKPEEIEELRNLELESTYNAIDALLIHFSVYQTNFIVWKENFESEKSLFLPSEKEFSKIISLSRSPFTYFRLVNLINETEENLITDILGNELFAEIKSQFVYDSLYTKYSPILALIKSLLANAVVAEALQTMPLDIIGLGCRIVASANLRTTKPAEIENQIIRYKDKTEYFKTKLEKYLNENKDFLPLYKPLTVKTRGAYDASSSIIRM